MPVQINEVIIKAVVDSNPASATGTKKPQPQSGKSCSEAEMAEKILEILREKKER